MHHQPLNSDITRIQTAAYLHLRYLLAYLLTGRAAGWQQSVATRKSLARNWSPQSTSGVYLYTPAFVYSVTDTWRRLGWRLGLPIYLSVRVQHTGHSIHVDWRHRPPAAAASCTDARRQIIHSARRPCSPCIHISRHSNSALGSVNGCLPTRGSCTQLRTSMYTHQRKLSKHGHNQIQPRA